MLPCSLFGEGFSWAVAWGVDLQQVKEAVVTPLPSVKSSVPKVASKLFANTGRSWKIL